MGLNIYNKSYYTENYQQKFNDTIKIRKILDELRILYLYIADSLNENNIKTLEEAKNVDNKIFILNKKIRTLLKDSFNPKYLTDNEKKQLKFLLKKYNDGTIEKAKQSINNKILFFRKLESSFVNKKIQKLCKEELKKRMGNKNENKIKNNKLKSKNTSNKYNK